MTMIHAFHLGGLWNEQRGANMLDTGAPYYEVYETSDGQWMAVGGIESQFYAALLEGLGLAGDPSLPPQQSRERLAGHEGALRRRLQDQDARRVDGGVRRHRRLRRPRALAVGGAPAPAQRGPLDLRRGRRGRAAGAGAPVLPDAVGACRRPPSPPGADTVSGLVEWGVDEDVVTKLRESGALS